MSAVVHARVAEQLTRLRLRYVAERLDAVLNEAARAEPTYLDFLDTAIWAYLGTTPPITNNVPQPIPPAGPPR